MNVRVHMKGLVPLAARLRQLAPRSKSHYGSDSPADTLVVDRSRICTTSPRDALSIGLPRTDKLSNIASLAPTCMLTGRIACITCGPTVHHSIISVVQRLYFDLPSDSSYLLMIMICLLHSIYAWVHPRTPLCDHHST